MNFKETVEINKLFIKNTHQAHDAVTNLYPSFYTNDLETVYILPYYFNNIEELIKTVQYDKENGAELEEFLRTKLNSNQLVMSLNGDMFVGCDIFDYLK